MAYKPIIGQHISVGGSVGTLIEITKKFVVVAGVYTYVPNYEGEEPHRDYWVARFSREEVLAADIQHRPIYAGTTAPCWNYEYLKCDYAPAIGVGGSQVTELATISNDISAGQLLALLNELERGMPEVEKLLATRDETKTTLVVKGFRKHRWTYKFDDGFSRTGTDPISNYGDIPPLGSHGTA